MKILLMSVMLVSMLFSMQKQIILGSYTVEKNAVDALELLKKNISTNEKLKKYIDINKLELKNKKIGNYSVVTVGEFSSYVWLFRTIEELQTYYKDAYTLDENLKKLIQKKVEKETPVVEEKKAPQEVAEVKIDAVEEAKQEEILEEVVEEEPVVKKPVEVKKEIVKKKTVKKVNKQDDDKYEMYYYVIAFLAILILIILIIATLIKRKVNKKEEE